MENDRPDNSFDTHFASYMALNGPYTRLLIQSFTADEPLDPDDPRAQSFISGELENAALGIIRPALQAAFITACEIRYMPSPKAGSLEKLTPVFFAPQPPMVSVLWHSNAADQKIHCYLPKPKATL